MATHLIRAYVVLGSGGLYLGGSLWQQAPNGAYRGI